MESKAARIDDILSRRYAAAAKHFQACMFKDNSFKLTYAASRDMHSVLRFCIPVAAELACISNPAYELDGSALHRVALAYSYCFTEYENNWEAMLAAHKVLFATPELKEASQVFLYCMGFVQLVYMLFMPYMAENMGETWPAKAETMLSGITRALLLDAGDRKKLIQGLSESGTMPATQGMSKLLLDTASLVFYKQLRHLADTGEVSMEAADA